MVLGNIITDYSVVLFIHVLAVVLAFGPTFSFGILLLLAERHPRATPAFWEAIRKIDNFLVDPGMLVVLLAGIYLLAEGPWESSDAFISVGFIAIIALFGLVHGVFRPQGRKAQALAERDLEAGDALSDEYLAVVKRLSMVGPIAALIVVMTVFFMVVKP